MSETKDLLIEIGTEELPPKSLSKLADAFATGIEGGLVKAELAYKDIKWFATPRRLAVIVSNLDTQQADKQTTRRGPALTAAYDNNGNPTPAAKGFAQSCNVDVNDLETLKNDKGEWLCYQILEKGKNTEELIPGIANDALSRLPIQKRMRWGNGETEFVRPVHWVVVLFGKDVVPCTILGITASDETYGHRFHHPQAIALKKPTEYLEKLKTKGKVIADFQQRHESIYKQIDSVAKKCNGHTIIDPGLLDEVTGLVEWPVVIAGKFDKKFLNLPSEVLVACMQDQQKYFPVFDKNKNLLPWFIAVTNIESNDPEIIRTGNERVIHPRLSDAQFFWQRDLEKPLSDFQQEMKGVVFQNKLGTLADKSERIAVLAEFIADKLGFDRVLAQRAGSLSKYDLLTELVGEFPKLQGVMGRYYAKHNNEQDEVAIALDEQYMPRFAGDDLPKTPTGQILSIADKLDTLVGIFAIGDVPTGDKDPFALRRAALGCLRIMIECQLELDLQECIDRACSGYDKKLIGKEINSELFDFMMERLRRYYVDSGISVDIFEAVISRQPTQPYDFHQRINAVMDFRKLPEAESLASANKRISNILKQADNKIGIEIDKKLLKETAEQQLASALCKVSSKVKPMLNNNQYGNALAELASLREQVDTFFDEVMVMCDDDALKNNRLALLNNLNSLFLETADISRLQN